MASKHNATFLDSGFTLIGQAPLLRLEYIRIETHSEIMIYFYKKKLSPQSIFTPLALGDFPHGGHRLLAGMQRFAN